MLLSLVDFLRCPNAGHEKSPLVLSVASWAGPRVAEGLLGCPVCHARYAIRRGAVDFTGGAAAVKQAPAAIGSDALRLAAQLALSEPGGVILLACSYAAVHQELVAIVDVTCILTDAVQSSSPGAVNFELMDRLPLADGVLRGAAVGEPRNTEAFLNEVARSVRSGGRIVAPAHSPVPADTKPLARDESEWVREVEHATPTIPISRARRPYA